MFEKNKINSKIEEYEKLILDENFWKDQVNAQKILKEKKKLDDLFLSFKNSVKESKDLEDFFTLASEENNSKLIQETTKNIELLRSQVQKNEIKCFLSKEVDINDCFVEIHAGAGGTESQDWADMLRRMYMKWSNNRGFKCNIISEHKGDEAGIKSATIKINGDYAFGWLKSESGIHRLVRISPFDSGARRHTSFASVWVYPVVDDSIDIHIQEKDLRVDTYRSSGAGGQHVNTTDSAVRITHIPTKIVVQCQNDRSQHKNKETCMQMLKARLYNYELEKREKESLGEKNQKKDIGWGHQIRSYVLHPYRLVKDNRTNFESSDPDKVLNGEIDNFLESSLFNING
ncbi:peptide chain release factor 2 [Candidatus Pelagibacter sp.]|nr:peptide chain release factor 2 [Candidatus Pelagibacter sp.]